MTRHFNLADLFELVAAEVPDRTALVAGEVRLTFGELDARTNRLARHFVDRGLQPGAKVAIYAWNRAEWVEAFLAAFKARLIPINVNYRYIAHELRYLFDNADAEALIFERSFAATVAEIVPDLPKLTELLVLEDGSDDDAGAALRYEDALAASSPEALAIERSSDDLYFLYTGGTTGMPKGVMWRGEDIFFADRLIEAVEAFDVVGVAGTRVLHPGQTAWFEDPLTKEPDRGNLSGAVGHGRTAFSTIFRYGPPRLACELLDGMFLAAKRATLLTANLRFDPAFDFHFYDLDFCRSARAKGLTLGTWPIVLGHASHGAYDSPAWAEKRDDYLRKWGE